MEEHGTKFYVHRVLTYAIICLLYALVFFQRVCPSVVTEDMAADYNIEKSELSVFSSIFFYPYGVMQLFAGILSDIVDPAYLIGVSHLVAAIGGFICGTSKSLAVGSIGRFLVGLGCGPTYVPVCRYMINWFPLKIYPIMTGVLLAIGGIGGIIAQGPLAAFAEAFGWRWAFYGISMIGAVLAILTLVFVRGDPLHFGYKPVNPELEHSGESNEGMSKLAILWRNVTTVVSFKYFWVIVVFCILSSAPYFAVSGLWAAPYMKDILGYSNTDAGSASISLSVGMVLGSLICPVASNYFKTRKWVLFAACFIGTLSTLAITLWGPDMSFAVIFFFLTVFGMFSNALTSLAYPFVREYYHPSIAATSVGSANFMGFLSSAVYQSLSSVFIKSYGHQPGTTNKYTEKGYQIGLWLFTTISMALGTIVITLAKDIDLEEPEKEDHQHEDVSKTHPVEDIELNEI